MTTIQTFEDILAAMRDNPVLREAMRQHVRDEEFNTRVLSELADLKTDVAELKTDVAELKTDVAELKTDVAELKTDVAELKTDVARMDARQDRMEGQLSNLTGTAYERKVARRAANAVRRYLGVRDAELVYSLANPESSHLSNLLYQATEANLISDEQVNDLEDADLILMGQSSDGEPTYVVAEVSITIDDSDVDRAARRARTLQTASGLPAQPVVIGTTISDANRQRTDASQVAYIAIAE